LGRLFSIDEDADLPEKWFKAEADEGNAEGQFFLGAMYSLPQRASLRD
jgi:TPR repeat protein